MRNPAFSYVDLAWPYVNVHVPHIAGGWKSVPRPPQRSQRIRKKRGVPMPIIITTQPSIISSLLGSCAGSFVRRGAGSFVASSAVLGRVWLIAAHCLARQESQRLANPGPPPMGAPHLPHHPIFCSSYSQIPTPQKRPPVT